LSNFYHNYLNYAIVDGSILNELIFNSEQAGEFAVNYLAKVSGEAFKDSYSPESMLEKEDFYKFFKINNKVPEEVLLKLYECYAPVKELLIINN
ncbi:MAG: hypothetical protein FWE37_08905, partial [Spirochaetaceae bacterium]|nr:hypothetical protein [Spirochaetaceae bacterium]